MSEEQYVNEGNFKDEIHNSKKDVANENILSPETIEQNKTQNQTSEIPKSEIKNMEVHHHPHVEKKNFKEYFLEFIMIFLAVTMGFFAEQIRESFVQRSEEKEYVQSFYEDLSSDER